MNDFTKEELRGIYDCVKDRCQWVDNSLIVKVKSMIDNYQDNKYTIEMDGKTLVATRIKDE